MYTIFTTNLIFALYTDARKGVFEETGSEQPNIAHAAPNELKLGKVGQSDESWPSAGWRCRGVFVRRRLRKQQSRFGAF